MVALTTAQVRDVIAEAIRGENRKVITAAPGLAWMLPELDGHLVALDDALGGTASDATLDEERLDAGVADVAHDDTRRHLYYLLHAGLYVGVPAQRAAVQTALDLLFPDGLRSVRVSYRQEVADNAEFAKRLERDDVAAGLAAAGEFVKRIDDRAKACVRAGEALGEVMRRIDAAEAAELARPADRARVDARSAALVAWSTFVTNVEHVLAGSDPETVRKREGLLRRWRALKAETARPAASAPATEPVPAEPETDLEPV